MASDPSRQIFGPLIRAVLTLLFLLLGGSLFFGGSASLGSSMTAPAAVAHLYDRVIAGAYRRTAWIG